MLGPIGVNLNQEQLKNWKTTIREQEVFFTFWLDDVQYYNLQVSQTLLESPGLGPL
jgi:hypothetical protein